MRVLLVEPWFSGSHRRWAEGYARHSAHDVTIIELSGQLWRWRLRAGAVPLAASIREELWTHGQPDVLVVSGMVDVSSLLGLLRGSLDDDVPVVAYMHESQLVYPTTDGNPDDDAVLRNWHSWCASDLVLFNSVFHLEAVASSIGSWLERCPEPDQAPELPSVLARFEVLPLGVEPPAAGEARPARPTHPDRADHPVILWPHRWEPDKAPEVFARALAALRRRDLEFWLVLAGDDPSASPVRAEIEHDHRDRILASGPLERAEYERWLFDSDIVVSCADHEFFGVAIVEAALAGCLPVLPNSLSYPEIIPPQFHSAVLYRPGTFGTRLADVLRDPVAHRAAVSALPTALEPLTWQNMAPRYDKRFAELTLRSTRC